MHRLLCPLSGNRGRLTGCSCFTIVAGGGCALVMEAAIKKPPEGGLALSVV